MNVKVWIAILRNDTGWIADMPADRGKNVSRETVNQLVWVWDMGSK